MPDIEFVGVDLEGRPYAPHRVDITNIPSDSNSYDAIICIHVLEHVEDDLKAIDELYRVLKPGGWALISVPIDFNRKTYEDPTIVDPDQRREHFGEEQHVRLYGNDFADRLIRSGFEVSLDRGEDVPAEIRQQYGLMDNENVFHCRKA